MGTKDKAEKDELDVLQEKCDAAIEKTAPKNPCPYCGQELPSDVMDTRTMNITLNLRDANEYGEARAEEDYWRNKLDLDREDMNEFFQDTAAKYGYFNTTPGIDWDDGVLTGVDVNGATKKTEIEVTKEEVKKAQQMFSNLLRAASKARKAVAKRSLKINELAKKYGWGRFPCDIRSNKFVDVTDEVLKQQNVRLDQIEQQLRQPKLTEDGGK